MLVRVCLPRESGGPFAAALFGFGVFADVFAHNLRHVLGFAMLPVISGVPPDFGKGGVFQAEGRLSEVQGLDDRHSETLAQRGKNKAGAMGKQPRLFTVRNRAGQQRAVGDSGGADLFFNVVDALALPVFPSGDDQGEVRQAAHHFGQDDVVFVRRQRGDGKQKGAVEAKPFGLGADDGFFHAVVNDPKGFSGEVQMLLGDVLRVLGDERDGAGAGGALPQLAQDGAGVWGVEEMHVVNGEDERGAVARVRGVEVSVERVAELVFAFGGDAAGMPAAEHSENGAEGGEFGADDVGFRRGLGEGAKAGLREKAKAKGVVASGEQRAGVLHRKLPQPDIRTAALPDVNEDERGHWIRPP